MRGTGRAAVAAVVIARIKSVTDHPGNRPVMKSTERTRRKTCTREQKMIVRQQHGPAERISHRRRGQPLRPPTSTTSGQWRCSVTPTTRSEPAEHTALGNRHVGLGQNGPHRDELDRTGGRKLVRKHARRRPRAATRRVPAATASTSPTTNKSRTANRSTRLPGYLLAASGHEPGTNCETQKWINHLLLYPVICRTACLLLKSDCGSKYFSRVVFFGCVVS